MPSSTGVPRGPSQFEPLWRPIRRDPAADAGCRGLARRATGRSPLTGSDFLDALTHGADNPGLSTGITDKESHLKRRIALGVLLVLTAVPALAQTQGSAADEAAIKDLQKQDDAAWNAGDAAKAAATYADDGTFIDVQGVETRGRAAIEKGFAQVMSETKGATFAGTVDTIRFIRPDLALVQGTINITGGGMPPEGFKGHYLAVVAKQGGSWKILAVHDAAMPAPPPKE
jgi:uncharacterized protein (TIGR02246 family)